MPLPTTGVDAHGYKVNLEPTRVRVDCTLRYVKNYTGLSYVSYYVELLDGEWPSAEGACVAIYGSKSPFGATWGNALPEQDIRVLTVYTD